ncbi:hypothetical protein F5X96DRAFT_672015 [Biscogniauxia mediterranea]|nr:hypothetical protein F5X96DRAFT_672015 [Biscogniauxia mediterranea]
MDPLPGSSLSANVTAAISQPSQSSQGDYVLPQDIGAFQGQLLGTNGNNPRGVSSDETRGPVSQSVDVPMQNRVSPPIYTPGETTGETPEADPITLFLQQHPRTNTVHAYDRNESGIVTIHSLPETLHRANVYESSNVSGSFLRKTYTTLFFHLNEAEHGQLLARARASDIAISAQLPDRGLLWWPTADIDFNDDPHLPWSSVTAALINAGLLDTQAMQRVLDENRERLILGGHHGRPYDALFVDAQRRFASALLRRCCYIVAFEQHFLHYPYNQTISDSDFYFLLGPDPDTDDFVLRHGLLRAYAPPRPGEVSKPDPMINMYGFKHRDLLCIRYNSNVAETQSNWETIFRYHILQSWLGPSHCTNIRETLTCAFYHLSDLRKQAQPEDETQARQLLDFFPFASSTAAPLRSAALFRLEMDVAARLVERLWEDPRTPGSGRSRPMLRREQFSAVGSPRPGQWDDLPPGLQWTLLGWPRRTDLAEKYARFLKMPIPARTGTGEGQEQEQEE